jgi:hypothetical protein
MRSSLLLIALALPLLLVGCAHNTKCLGTVGDTTFYRVGSGRFVGPNFSALVTQNTNDNKVTIQQVFGGPGIGSATISAIGHVGAAAVLGTSFPSNVGDNVTVSGGNSGASAGAGASSHSAAGSSATGGTSSATGGSSSATGGTSTSTGSTHTPPGLVNNPGHSKP